VNADNPVSGDQRCFSGNCTGSSSLVSGHSQKRAAPASRTAQGVGGIDYRALRDQVPISSVLRLLNFKPSERRGDQLRGPCPIHGSSSPTSRSFSVNLRLNAFQCFGGSCGAHGNQMDLWAAAQRLPLYEASISLAERLGIDVPRLGQNRRHR
jgi:DNA primase